MCAQISRPNDYTPNTTAKSSEVDDDFNTIYDEFNGNIDNTNIKAGAGIIPSKIAGTALVQTPSSEQTITTNDAGNSALVLQEVASQTAPILKLLDSSGNLIVGISTGTARVHYFDSAKKNYIGYDGSGNIIARDANLGAQYSLQDMISSGVAADSSPVVKGILYLSTASITSTIPRALGANDPKVISSATIQRNVETVYDVTPNSTATITNINTLVGSPDNDAGGLHNHVPEDLIGVNGSFTATNANTLVASPDSDSDGLHTHGGLQLLSGTGKALGVKTYWNFVLPFVLSTNVPSGDFWTVVNQNTSGGLSSRSLQATGDNNNSIISTTLAYTGHDRQLRFDYGKMIIVEFNVDMNLAGTEQQGFGLSESNAPFFNYDDASVESVCFTINTDGKLYAHTSNGGGGADHTETEITGITLTNINTFRIEFDSGTDAKFYVNGVLEATITTTLPAGATVIQFGTGSSGNTSASDEMVITQPNFSVEK